MRPRLTASAWGGEVSTRCAVEVRCRRRGIGNGGNEVYKSMGCKLTKLLQDLTRDQESLEDIYLAMLASLGTLVSSPRCVPIRKLKSGYFFRKVVVRRCILDGSALRCLTRGSAEKIFISEDNGKIEFKRASIPKGVAPYSLGASFHTFLTSKAKKFQYKHTFQPENSV